MEMKYIKKGHLALPRLRQLPSHCPWAWAFQGTSEHLLLNTHTTSSPVAPGWTCSLFLPVSLNSPDLTPMVSTLWFLHLLALWDNWTMELLLIYQSKWFSAARLWWLITKSPFWVERNHCKSDVLIEVSLWWFKAPLAILHIVSERKWWSKLIRKT